MKRILVCFLCGIIAFLLVFTGVINTGDKTAEDVLYHRAGTMEGKIKIIKIDDKSMNKMGDFSTWNRDVWAELVNKLCVSDEVRPEVIGFDVLFSSEKIEESDKAFAEACAKYNNVVTGTSYVFGKEVATDENGMLDVNYLAVVDRVEPYNFEYQLISDVVQKEHKPVVESRFEKRSDFDMLIMRYLQAIHINEHVNAGANALIGGLWRNLYWLSKDVNDIAFAKYSAQKSVEKYKKAIDDDEIKDIFGRTSTAISLAAMLAALGDYKGSAHYCEFALDSPEERIKNNAIRLRDKVKK